VRDSCRRERRDRGERASERESESGDIDAAIYIINLFCIVCVCVCVCMSSLHRVWLLWLDWWEGVKIVSFRWWCKGQRRRIQPRSLWCLASGRDEGYWVATSSPCLFESSPSALVSLNLWTPIQHLNQPFSL